MLTRLFSGRTMRVLDPSRLIVDLDLGFRVRVHRKVVMEGAQLLDIPEDRREDALHCLVILVGGKRLILHTNNDAAEGVVMARVFLDEDVKAPPPGVMTTPYGQEEARLDVMAYMQFIASVGFDVKVVRETLNGSN